MNVWGIIVIGFWYIFGFFLVIIYFLSENVINFINYKKFFKFYRNKRLVILIFDDFWIVLVGVNVVLFLFLLKFFL